MRSPIYNDRGQFRYSDFVAYVPEYLKSEPDVVTLLQVFSDYINNAYRNVETVEKFEFAVVSREGDLSGAVRRMEYLRYMLDVAGARNDYVNLLSVPRANVKDNRVFGQDTGYSPYIVAFESDTVKDTIDGISSIDPGISAFDDGDVVFVSYTGLESSPDREIAYYYDRTMDRLVKDPEGSSQDPFTGSDNTSGRILSFRVSDVSSVETRYGHTTGNGTRYKEVFFTARIYDVKSESSVKEVTLSDGRTAVIDYYGTERTQAGKVRTVLRFDGETGWAWKDGMPTAVIYLSETSGAGLASVRRDGKDRLPPDSCVDPSVAGSMNRYPVLGEPSVDGNIVTVRLGTYYPAYSNGTVYLAEKRNLRIVGEFTVLKDDRENGSPDLRMVPTGTMPDLSGLGELVLMDLPFFYGRGVLDYTKASPLVRFDNVYALDSVDAGGFNLVPDARMLAYACEAGGNDRIGTLNIVRKDDPGRTADESYMDGGYVVVVPFTSEIAASFGKLFDLGDRIYIDGDHEYWRGLAIVKSFTAVADGYAIKLEGMNAIRPSRLGSPVTVRVARAGYVTVGPEGTGGQYSESMLSDKGSVVVLNGGSGKLAARMYPDGTFDREIPYGTYTVEILGRTGDRARNLLQVDDSGEMLTTVWERTRGDLFTRPYMVLEDGAGNTQVARVAYLPGEEVYPLDRGSYYKGQYVYDPVSGKVYMCVADCTVRDINSVADSNLFAEDRLVHYSVPYSEKYNAFAPYYGQIRPMEYGSRISYTDDPEVFAAPLYITKVEEKSLRYGWEHREFLNYGDGLNLSGRERNGMVELHSTERTDAEYENEPMTFDSGMDIVESDLFDRCTWSYPHGVVTKGCSPAIPVDIDDTVGLRADRVEAGRWRVTVHSAAHGLVDGTPVTVTGVLAGSVRGRALDFNVQFATVDVVDGDTFTYDVECDPLMEGGTCFSGSVRAVSAVAGDGTVKFSLATPAYGLSAGDMVTVEGCTVDGSPMAPGPYEVASVSDGRMDVTLSLSVTADPVTGGNCSISKDVADGHIVYMQDHHARVLSASLGDDGRVTVILAGPVHGPVPGDRLFLEGFTADGSAFPSGPYTVAEVNGTFTGITFAETFGEVPVPGSCAIVRMPIGEGDVVAITDGSGEPVKFYRVSSGIWPTLERDSIVTPAELFSQTNLFDISVTNPAIAMGDEIVVKDIIYNGIDERSGYGHATVHLAAPLPHFTEGNRKYIEGRTVVRIYNANPSDFNGYHLVTAVNGPTSFEIRMKLYNDYLTSAIPVGDRDMLLRECRWYRFAFKEIEWDKVSSKATFTARNVTTRTDGDTGTHADDGIVELMCECPHGLSEGDYAVLGYSFDAFDETTGTGEYAMGRVVGVPDGLNVRLEIVYGTYMAGMSIARGVISMDDDLQNRYDEYSVRLSSIGGEMYRFRDGDIVIAAGQMIPAERLSYLVRQGARWSVLKKKRIVKVRRASVDEYRNSYYMDGNFEDGLDEYKYTTYSDVDVAKASSWAYASRMYMVRNPVFNRPAIDGMDTTRDPNAEYSSGEDYGNVAPRTGMKSSFKGVPDLKYPLVEKIERLAYLRDANVIDFELIEYLARFMGYDLTPMAEDVRTSNLYRTVKQQEAAIREAVLNLPQYYALGGTDPGLKMLMGAFGVIGEVLTLYTNTMHPYEEMLNAEEVAGRLVEDSTEGKLEGTWVSTPYIDIELTDDSRFPQFAIQPDDISRIREQIRVWKPIQVVFRDVLLKYAGEVGMRNWISGPFVGIGEFGAVIGPGEGESDTVEDPQYMDPALTNCAF
jgi:hypothetical protein